MNTTDHDIAKKKQGRILCIRCVSQVSEKRRYGPRDGRTDGGPDGWTDRPSYRDARTHLIRPDSWPKMRLVRV